MQADPFFATDTQLCPAYPSEAQFFRVSMSVVANSSDPLMDGCRRPGNVGVWCTPRRAWFKICWKSMIPLYLFVSRCSFKSLLRLWISVGGGEKKRTRPREIFVAVAPKVRSRRELRSRFVSITNVRNYFGGHLWRVLGSLLVQSQA